ncbi:hypothetical protein [Saccharothrix deserti]|uniref:hypothetical protein n=1 Tax=Saccharothrix deserti TaxID=2593674 RepID=UPI00131AC89C|nr:hypothetical protein [Saccharothrix deserti]
MTDIGAAVTLAHTGDTTAARTRLQDLWDRIGPAGDPLHRCTLAHYMADLYDDPAQAIVWDVRALDAAAALTDERVQRHHGTLRIAGFYPSLHLNLADNFRRLGSFAAARDHITAAQQHQDALADDGYGTLIRRAISEVSEAINQRSTDKRASAPGPDAN